MYYSDSAGTSLHILMLHIQYEYAYIAYMKHSDTSRRPHLCWKLKVFLNWFRASMRLKMVSQRVALWDCDPLSRSNLSGV